MASRSIKAIEKQALQYFSIKVGAMLKVIDGLLKKNRNLGLHKL